MIQDRSTPSAASHSDTVVRFGVSRTVVHLRGEYDRTNASALASQLSGAIAARDSDVIVNLGGVKFMDASTISVLVVASAFLARRSRTLLLRSPSKFGRRLLDMCGLSDLVEVTSDRLMLSA